VHKRQQTTVLHAVMYVLQTTVLQQTTVLHLRCLFSQPRLHDLLPAIETVVLCDTPQIHSRDAKLHIFNHIISFSNRYLDRSSMLFVCNGLLQLGILIHQTLNASAQLGGLVGML
jgi:hypothetical protein